MKNAYLVLGSTGEYSDHCDWYFGVFIKEKAAEAKCEELNQWCRDKKVHRDNYDDLRSMEYSEYVDTKCPLDPQFKCDYTGTDYIVFEVDLYD